LQRDKKKFFFLKGGLDVPPDQEDGSGGEKVEDAQPAGSTPQ
jgi:hypothetical protein